MHWRRQSKAPSELSGKIRIMPKKKHDVVSMADHNSPWSVWALVVVPPCSWRLRASVLSQKKYNTKFCFRLCYFCSYSTRRKRWPTTTHAKFQIFRKQKPKNWAIGPVDCRQLRLWPFEPASFLPLPRGSRTWL